MKLDVTYISQHRDIQDKYWQKRACGLVCLKMVLDFHQIKVPEINEFLEIALKKESYHNLNGWIHDKLLELARDYGFKNSHRKEFKSKNLLKQLLGGETPKLGGSEKSIREIEGIKEIVEFLEEGNPVIVSISAIRFLDEFEGKFHQVVLTGYDEQGFYYNDPGYKNEEGKDLHVDINTFKKYWRKMVIFIKL